MRPLSGPTNETYTFFASYKWETNNTNLIIDHTCYDSSFIKFNLIEQTGKFVINIFWETKANNKNLIIDHTGYDSSFLKLLNN